MRAVRTLVLSMFGLALATGAAQGQLTGDKGGFPAGGAEFLGGAPAYGTKPDFVFTFRAARIDQVHPNTVGAQVYCKVCDGICPPGTSSVHIAQGWKIIEIKNLPSWERGVTINAYSSIGDRALRPRPENGTHYWCGLFLWGDPMLDMSTGPPNPSRAIPAAPGYGTSIPAFARAVGTPMTVVLSGAIP